MRFVSGVCLAFFVSQFALVHAQTPTPPKPSGRLGFYQFTNDCDNPTLPVINQQGGTCWCYASTSFVEAEILRKTGKHVDLSEAHTVRFAFLSRARHHVLRQGYSYFDEGGDSHDILLIAKKHGVVPLEQYPGFTQQSEERNPQKMLTELKAVVAPAADPIKKQAKGWQEKFTEVLDNQLGKPVTEFEYEGRSTPLNPSWKSCNSIPKSICC